MAPKKKKGKGGRKKAANIVDGLSPNEMSPAQLLGHIKRLQAEIDREREERNFFMLEREKLFTLWNLAVEQLSEEKQKARLIDVQMEQNKKEAKSEMDLYKQKLRFLQAEQSKKLGLVRLSHLEKMRKVQDEVWAIQLLMKESLASKKKQLRNSQVSLFELLRRMHMEHADKTSTMRKQFANEIRRIEMSMDRQLERERESMELEAKQEMNKMVQLKEDQLQRMMAGHEKQTLEMKTFFNDLAVNNFAVISSLQHDIANKKIEEQRSRRELKEAKSKYYALLEPIKDMEKQVADWNEEQVNMKEVHDELKSVNAQVESNQRYARMIECANEALSQRIVLMKDENGAFKKEFVKELLEVQKRASMQRLVMEMRINALKDESEFLKALIEAKAKLPTSMADLTPDEQDGNVAEWNAMMAQFLEKRNEPNAQIRETVMDTTEKIRIAVDNMKDASEKAGIPFEEIGYPLKIPGVQSTPAEGTTGALYARQTPAKSVKKSMQQRSSSSKDSSSKESKMSVSQRSTKSAKIQ